MIPARPVWAIVEYQDVPRARQPFWNPMRVVLRVELPVRFRAGAVSPRVPPAVEEISAFAAAPALMAGRLGSRRAVVDDPELAELPNADGDLIELGVIGHAVHVR